VFNVNRGKDTPMIPLESLKAYRADMPSPPAREPIPPHAPGETPPGYWRGKFGLVKLAPPGMRYPSSRPPGVPDDIIERLDAYSMRVNKHG